MADTRSHSQIDPPHYHGVTRAGRRIEVIDVIEGYGLGYHLGNAVKYICRAGRKTLDPRTDLGKARWYVRRAGEQSASLARLGGRRAYAPAPAEIAEAFGLDARRSMALGVILSGADMADAAHHLTVALDDCAADSRPAKAHDDPAGEHFACEIAEICRRTGVTILKHKAGADSWKVGDTLAVGAIETTHRKYGAAVVEAALAAVTGSRDGNAGQLRADVIKTVAANIVDHELDRAAATEAMQRVDIAVEIGEATVTAVESRRPVHVELTHRLARHFAAVRRGAPARQLEEA